MSKKIKKRKFNFKKFFKFIITIVFLILLYIYLSNKPIKNILVKNTYFLTDEQVIEAAGIDSYPSFLKALSFKIKKNIKRALVKSNRNAEIEDFLSHHDIDKFFVIDDDYFDFSEKIVKNFSLFLPLEIEFYGKWIKKFWRLKIMDEIDKIYEDKSYSEIRRLTNEAKDKFLEIFSTYFYIVWD